jgi:hypothetical protein
MKTYDPLVLDLVQWVAREPRTYAEVLDAWKTSCPRLTVWEDAVDEGLVTRKNIGARGTIVVLTGLGRAVLDAIEVYQPARARAVSECAVPVCAE